MIATETVVSVREGAEGIEETEGAVPPASTPEEVAVDVPLGRLLPAFRYIDE
jgi:hypothetical protein